MPGLTMIEPMDVSESNKESDVSDSTAATSETVDASSELSSPPHVERVAVGAAALVSINLILI